MEPIGYLLGILIVTTISGIFLDFYEHKSFIRKCQEEKEKEQKRREDIDTALPGFIKSNFCIEIEANNFQDNFDFSNAISSGQICLLHKDCCGECTIKKHPEDETFVCVVCSKCNCRSYVISVNDLICASRAAIFSNKTTKLIAYNRYSLCGFFDSSYVTISPENT